MSQLKGGVDLAAKAQADQMDQMDELVTKLTNFEAFIMEKSILAAKSLVERNLTDLGHTTHGPDSAIGGQGGSAGSHPATPLIALKLYEQVRKSMRSGPAGDLGDESPESPFKGGSVDA